MPHVVEKKIRARRLSKGHEFRWRGAWWGIDEDPVTKKLYTYIDVGHDEPFRLPADADIRIRVTEDTPKEKYDKLLEGLEGMIAQELGGALATRNKALETLRSSEDPSHWELDRWVTAKSKYDIWAYFARVLYATEGAERDTPLDDVLSRVDEGTFISVMEECLVEMRREVWRAMPGIRVCLSSSIELIKKDATREFVDRWEMLLAPLGALAKKIEETV